MRQRRFKDEDNPHIKNKISNIRSVFFFSIRRLAFANIFRIYFIYITNNVLCSGIPKIRSSPFLLMRIFSRVYSSIISCRGFRKKVSVQFYYFLLNKVLLFQYFFQFSRRYFVSNNHNICYHFLF